MAKRNLTWETAFWSGSTSNGAAVATVPYGGGSPGTVVTQLVTDEEVESSDRDRIWIERIIGQVFHKGFNAAIVPPLTNIIERVSIGTQFAAGVSVVSTPWAAAEALDNFLWQRVKGVDLVSSVVGSSTLSNQVCYPYWNNIDIRVGRLLRPGQFLSYTVQTDAAVVSGGSSVVVHGWMRVLLSR